MATPSPNIKVKLIVSYVLFLLMLLTALFFIYQKVRNYSTIDQSSKLQTDSILILVQEKDAKMQDLVKSISDLNDNFLQTTQEIEEYIADSYDIPIIQKKTVTTSDTILPKEVSNRFLDKLAAALLPNRESAVEVKTTVKTQIDTVYDMGVNRETIQKIKTRLQKERSVLKKRQKRMTELQGLNTVITQQIDSLFSSYEQEQLNLLMSQVEKDNYTRQNAFQLIGGIAIASILLIIVFATLLVRDLNKSNRYRRQLELANKRAEDLLRAREKLMLTITHDIKAPTGTIMGYSDLMRNTPLTSQQKDYLSNIDVATSHISRLIHDLLDYHMLDLNKGEINNESFNLLLFIEESLELFIPLYQKKGLELSSNYNEQEIDMTIKSDPHRIRQILSNLLSNALKFTDKGGVTLVVRCLNQELLLSIEDTGKGISISDQKRIFEEFTRLPSAQGKEGFGLGLSIVSKIIKAMGGTIEVDSIINKGTKFKVIIPFEEAINDDIKANEIPNTDVQNEGLLLKDLNIAVIDDDPLQLKLTKTILQRAGAEVAIASNLNDLLHILDEQNYNILITDIQMPEISGYDLACLLKQSNKASYNQISIIGVSAREQVRNGATDVYFKGILNKPFSAREVSELYFGLQKSSIDDVQNVLVDKEYSVDGLLTFVAGDKNAEREVIASFISETRNNLITLNQLLQNRKYAEISKLAHKMLPVFRMIQHEGVCSVLLELEKDITNYAFEECLEKVEYLNKEIYNLVDEALHNLKKN